MANNTRSHSTITDLEKKNDDRFELLSGRLDEMSSGMEELRRLLRAQALHQLNGKNSSNNNRSSQNEGREDGHSRRDPPLNNYSTRISKVEFPRFDGSQVKEWMYKCEQFFLLDGTPADSRVRLASIHLDGLALQWHLNYMRARCDLYPPWTQYAADVITRFGEAYADPLANLIQVKQHGKVQDYIDAFELALTQVSLIPEHSLSIFLAGLEHTTQMHVRMFNPTTISQAANLAKLHEASQISTNKPTFRSVFTTPKPLPLTTKQPPNSTPNSTPSLPSPTQKPIFNKVPRTFNAAEMADRRAKGLCMFCDEPFTPSHQLKHKRTQLLVMEMEDDDSTETETASHEEAAGTASLDEVPQLSLNTMAGLSNYHTMRVTGMYDRKLLQILLDSGSTHNFLDLEMAKKLGCKLEKVDSLPVAAGGGTTLEAPYICRGFTWKLQHVSFTADVIVLPLVLCDLILGIQWLRSLGPVLWDFDKLQMEFSFNGKKFVLRGAKPSGVKLINNKTFSQAVQQGAQICFLYLDHPHYHLDIPSCQLHHSATGNPSPPLAIDQLLTQFADIFREPTELPPSRPGFDHKIPLKDGTNPFSIQPYRYSILQKDIIDKLVEDMLKQGLIQHSNSPFASSVVLVRKKNGNWRLCVDYRKLNQHTIKDKFPIPLIEDLMDELGGATIFSKLDLTVGYHQLRMDRGEEYKTAFKTHAGHFEYLVMPFGLSNAPAFFQALMHHIFHSYLRRFVIIFFDDILIYSPSLEDHVAHLHLVFQTIRDNKLFLRKEKCCFATDRVEYLGHFITKEGVSTDPSKIHAVANWPQPSNLKQLRGFLGLAGYYRRFVKDFGKIAKPLNDMLKKDCFSWSDDSVSAFLTLKHALVSAPVLALPDFSKPFVVETDASGKGIGVVLMQEQHPIAYISKSLGPKQQAMSIYERELLAIVYAVQKWGTYLAHAHFIIRTDQKSIKHMLEQRLNTPFQQVWMAKLMGFDFEIHYKKGVENRAADALSRKAGAELLPMLLDNGQTGLLDTLKSSWVTDTTLQRVIKDLQQDASSHPKFSWHNNELRRKGKLVVGEHSDLNRVIPRWLHDSSFGGHSGRDATAARVKSLFFWKGMNKDIQNYIRECDVCQRSKPDLAAYPGLLQPLPIPTKIWDQISMDFIEGLPSSGGKHVIMVVVDRLSKYAHFIALTHPYIAIEVAQIFLDHIFKLHGLPSTITSDRDPIFISKVWNELFQL